MEVGVKAGAFPAFALALPELGGGGAGLFNIAIYGIRGRSVE